MQLALSRRVLFVIIMLLGISNISIGQIGFPFNSSFKFARGGEGDTLSINWNEPGYSDDLWESGTAPFWYGDGTGGTNIPDMANTYSTLYLRTNFTASNVHLIETIQLQVDYDDGFILWFNGEEVLRQNAPTTPSYDAFAPANHESGAAETFFLDAGDFTLVEGNNLLAVQGFNVSLGSSDFHFNISVSAEKETPVLPDSLGQVSFSHQSGYYDASFLLQISANDTLQGHYTLDGSHPGTSATAVAFSGSASLTIDPSSSAGGGVTPGVVVRVSMNEEGYEPSYPLSRTFIFPEAVKDQGHPGGIWPTDDVNGQWLDFPMDTDITRGTRYGGRMDDAFLDIPAFSIITDNDNLFGSEQGIYVNAFGHGREWERECSVELIYPDSVAFQTNAGLRIRGGWSRHPNFPKHAFRLFFRSEYGDGKLNYPLFGDEGVDRYDKIDLRTSMNYAWAQGDSRNTMVREVFSRDLQRDMGQPYTRSRYYHLYLNGMYWGLFQTQERSEARFAAEHFGGEPEDYDVVKVNTEDWNYRIEATDGNLDHWQEIYDQINLNMANMSRYNKLQGLDNDGNTRRDLYKLIDIDNLIDYMITIFYAGNFDAPTSSFMRNNGCNNFFAINERTNPTTGYMFFNHDAEHAMFYEPASPGIGIEEDRVNLADRTDNMRMEVSGFDRFHPQWLHHKLTDNPEYTMRFKDRAYKYLKPGGLFTEDVSVERLNARVEQIDKAIIAESARWGDTHRSDALHRDVHWIQEVRDVRENFLSERPEVLIGQLIEGGLYSEIESPELMVEDQLAESEYIYFSGSVQVKLSNVNFGGAMYYTINDLDPRAVGGEVYWKATREPAVAVLDVSETTVIRARTLDNGEWSALTEVVLTNEDEDYAGLKITEIHYHPLDSVAGTDTISGKAFEFLEFKNTGTSAINLEGLELDSAVRYQFPEGAVILPREFYVVVSKPVRFFNRYGKIGTGNFKGNLSNGGEMILLKDAEGDIVMQFRYDDQNPWPIHADGMGFSIVPTKASPDMDPGLADYWVRSARIGGSPFKNDGNSDQTFVKEEIIDALTIYPNPATDYFIVQLDNPSVYDPLDIKLIDLTGKEVYRSAVMPGERISLDNSGLRPGVYIVEISGNELQQRTKLVIAE